MLIKARLLMKGGPGWKGSVYLIAVAFA